jgi:acetylornithine aminotransferase
MLLQDIDKKFILDTYAKQYINFTKGENATLYDCDGKKFIDFGSGIGVVSVGHGNKKIAQTIYKQVSNIIHISNLFMIEPQVKLAKKLVELSGYDMKCFFSNSGAEANEAAIKIARKYGQQKYNGKRFKVITLENSFHGRTITTAKATGQPKIHKIDFSPYPEGFHFDTNIAELKVLMIRPSL